MKRIFMFLVAALMACTTTFAQSQNENVQEHNAVDKTQLIKMRTATWTQ